MPKTTPNDTKDDGSDKPTGRVARWWQKFHFSGRVIMCSVLFGFGLILIGSIVFAINVDDDSSKPENDEDFPGELPTKPPSNVVGPVVMGIGSFIVIVGIVMCLFETQVCRKKTGDASPLISERAIHGKDPSQDAVPSTSHGNSNHRHGARKPGASPKRTKRRYGKSHSKERSQQSTPSPSSPPVAIETQKSYMTSSEDNFLTPPNTLSVHQVLVHNNSQNTENQTSSSLMKSFTSSGPSWNQSTEFQTPSTSFRDSSVSLESSTEVGEDQKQGSVITSELYKIDNNSGFMKPATLEPVTVHEMADNIKHQKEELSNAQKYSTEKGICINNSDKEMIPHAGITTEPGKDVENIYNKSVLPAESTVEANEECENVVNKISSEQPSLATQQIKSFINESHQESAAGTVIAPVLMQNEEAVTNLEETSINIDYEQKMTDNVPSVSEHQPIIREDNQISKSNSPEEFSNNAMELNKDKSDKPILEDDESTSKSEDDKNDELVDLESSVSSDETVISRDSLLQARTSSDVTKENDLDPRRMLEVGAVNLNIAESKNSVSSILIDGVDTQKSQSSMKESGIEPIESIDSQSEDIKVDESNEKHVTANSS